MESTSIILFHAWNPKVKRSSMHGIHMGNVIPCIESKSELLFHAWNPQVKCYSMHGIRMLNVILLINSTSKQMLKLNPFNDVFHCLTFHTHIYV